MRRVKKIIFKISIIALLLFIFYYFGGWYFSKNQCIQETLQGYYITNHKKIMELEGENYTAILYADTNSPKISIVGIKKFGILYHQGSSAPRRTIDQTRPFYPYGSYNSDIGFAVFIYRNDPSIERIEISMNNGNLYVLDEWNNDFVGLYLSPDDITENFPQGTYRAYDNANQVIYERKY